jgi:chemotaxis protein CheD
MNHFLLPAGEGAKDHHLRYGVQAMELLINALLEAGAARKGLAAKAFGGARMTPGLTNIGAGNIRFARYLLASEGIPLVSESFGGERARRIRFWPATGFVRMRLVRPSEWPQVRPHFPLFGCFGLF